MNTYLNHFVLLLFTTIAAIASAFLVNGAFYTTVFKEDDEASDFESTDVSPTSRWKAVMRYVGFYSLFTLVFFAGIALMVYLYFKGDGSNNQVEKFRELFDTTFVLWFIIGVFVTYLIFTFYTMSHKDFLVNLKIPQPSSEEIDPIPQPKLFLWVYAFMTIIMIIFGLCMRIAYLDVDVNYLAKMFRLGYYGMFLAVISMIIYHFMIGNIPFGVMYIVVYIAIIIAMYKLNQKGDFLKID